VGGYSTWERLQGVGIKKRRSRFLPGNQTILDKNYLGWGEVEESGSRREAFEMEGTVCPNKKQSG